MFSRETRPPDMKKFDATAVQYRNISAPATTIQDPTIHLTNTRELGFASFIDTPSLPLTQERNKKKDTCLFPDSGNEILISSIPIFRQLTPTQK